MSTVWALWTHADTGGIDFLMCYSAAVVWRVMPACCRTITHMTGTWADWVHGSSHEHVISRKGRRVHMCVGKKRQIHFEGEAFGSQVFLITLSLFSVSSPLLPQAPEVTFRGYCYLKWQQIQCVQCRLGRFGPCDLAVRQTGCQSSRKRRRKSYPADWRISDNLDV